MSEIRTKFRPLVGKRIKLRGILGDVRDDHKGTRICVVQPEYDDEVMCDHIWVLRCRLWVDQAVKEGSQVAFSALVSHYSDPENNGARNYCLTSPDALEIKHQAALAIPDPRETEKPSMPVKIEDDEPPPESAVPQDGIAAMRQVKRFVKCLGGIEQTERTLAALDELTLSLDEVKEWVAVLKEE